MGLFKRRLLCLLLLFVSVGVVAQNRIKVSEFLQESKIASTSNNKLYFVDFWATWCGPCITAKEHLGVLQKQFQEDLYIVSLTSENPLTVERFLQKKPTDLAIAIDYNKETFKDYNVAVLPDGVLFNSQGIVLWRGGAPDLKKEIVAKYLRQNSSKSSLDDIFNIQSIQEDIVVDYSPKENLEIKALNDKAEELQVADTQNYLKLSGSLRQIVGYLAKIYKNQIVLDESLDSNYEVYFKKPLNQSENLAVKLITEMNLGVVRKYNEGEGISFTTDASKFWDTKQIDWGINNAKYLVGDSQIQADNVSLRDVAYQLAYVLDMPIIVPEDNEISLSLHDWDFHYKFFQLMQSDLEDNYGIIAEKKKVSYPVYHIEKKEP
ncbi:TlpA family protein disulfide reductase [Winogradskyella endarachnes]|uniref:Redoxin domain-containing protein n=1 Tax=Winogradskyella endarachnes TaxID=2681965 RepID=A0A6L6UAZ2_9FLAO|nr:TlpA disulfide reductase family protein [Winogradskyella endarachnes]MUU78067.1 redoxin domain-containing protein [Winogradskyella endarachnes]